MTTIQKILLFIILPIIALLSYPPKIFDGGLPLIFAVAILFIALGVLIWRGRSLALRFAIFVQGVNVIIRIMMFFSLSSDKEGAISYAGLITMTFGIALSIYLLLRLDKADIRLLMVK
ncbi:MAG: hypothetical protein IT308_03440 [Anaerolineaceae bacterium]|nr:hypothetical protein [Anaerolineaceae bacterium]